jgi:hypothetical protein
MKIKSLNDVQSSLLENAYYGSDMNNLEPRERKKLIGFTKSYSVETFKKLNESQLELLFILFVKQSENTDHLSVSFGKGRRSTINTANALVRRGLLFWDLPTSSNMDGGYDLTLDRDAMLTTEHLGH